MAQPENGVSQFYDARLGEWVDFDAPTTIEVEVTDNPVVAVLLGPDGEVLIEGRERPAFGYRSVR